MYLHIKFEIPTLNNKEDIILEMTPEVNVKVTVTPKRYVTFSNPRRKYTLILGSPP